MNRRPPRAVGLPALTCEDVGCRCVEPEPDPPPERSELLKASIRDHDERVKVTFAHCAPEPDLATIDRKLDQILERMDRVDEVRQASPGKRGSVPHVVVWRCPECSWTQRDVGNNNLCRRCDYLEPGA